MGWQGGEMECFRNVFFGNYEYIISFCIASFAGRARKREIQMGDTTQYCMPQNFKINRFYFHLQVMKDKSQGPIISLHAFCNCLGTTHVQYNMWPQPAGAGFKMPQKNADKLYKLHVYGALVHAYFWPEIWRCLFWHHFRYITCDLSVPAYL